MEAAVGHELACDIVEQAVDIAAALGRGIHLCDVHILVNANADGDVREIHYLCQCRLKDYHIHYSQAV